VLWQCYNKSILKDGKIFAERPPHRRRSPLKSGVLIRKPLIRTGRSDLGPMEPALIRNLL